MEVKGFYTTGDRRSLSLFLKENVRICGVRLLDGFCFVEYEEIDQRSTINLVRVVRGGITDRVPDGFNFICHKDNASNFHWDVHMDRENLITTFIVFWEEPSYD